jgi:hypothetical protein
VANGVALRMAVLYQLIVPGADGIKGSEVPPTAVTVADTSAQHEADERSRVSAR